MSPASKLADIATDKITPNPHNPRLMFRPAELEELQESIRRYGVQVPITVYREGNRYVLLDGERRWRCSLKLNKETIPALVVDKPTPFENLILMFNIHALREQWDLLTIAMMLPEVIRLHETEVGSKPNERELSSATGLSRGVIRRCKLLIELPQQYKDMLLEELQKPKAAQRLSEDFFIEMEKALKTASRAMPGTVPNKDGARKLLIRKYKQDVIRNIVDFRKVGKIARAGKVGADEKGAAAALTRLFTDPGYSIDDAYQETVSTAYAERDVVSRIEGLITRLEGLEPDDLDDDVRERLEELILRAQELLESDE